MRRLEGQAMFFAGRQETPRGNVDERRLVAGRYRLIDELGRGGMSVVYRGHDRVLNRDVAVKVIANTDPDGVSRDVKAEALATARLAHPHVATVFDFVEEGSEAFVVMELLQGGPLSCVAEPLPPDVACRLVAQIASALAAAHAIGLVHLDVKPGNIMLTPSGPKVFDFGLAAATGTPEEIGAQWTVLGTPAYIAPERLAAAAVTPASDVYALGVVLFWLLAHELPWPGNTRAEIVAAHLTGTPADLPPGVTPAVGRLYRRCLARDPDSRPTAGEVASALATVANRRSPKLPRALAHR